MILKLAWFLRDPPLKPRALDVKLLKSFHVAISFFFLIFHERFSLKGDKNFLRFSNVRRVSFKISPIKKKNYIYLCVFPKRRQQEFTLMYILIPSLYLCYITLGPVNFDNTLIHHKIRVFRKRFLNRRNLKTPASHILVERKLPKGSFSKKMTPG